jgi:hypothetical protein
MNMLANLKIGRITLHLLCILRGGEPSTHLVGVTREFSRSNTER